MPYTVTDIQRIVDAQRAFFRTGETLDIKWRWARPERHFSGLMCFPSLTTKVYKMPYGVTLVISPFNFPVLLTLGVVAKAADNLTPVALELGGETGNWCIVRKDADIADAARKIAFFKLCNAGQICININQVAVAQEIADEFLEALKTAFVRQIGENAQDNEEYPKLITRRHRRRHCQEGVVLPSAACCPIQGWAHITESGVSANSLMHRLS